MKNRKSEAFTQGVVGVFMLTVLLLMGYFTIVISGVDVLSGRHRVPVRVAFSQVGGLKDRDKIRKFEALFLEAERYREEHDEWPGLYNVCREIVEHSAPEYFICHNTAKQMILRERKKRREEIARKWAR